MLSSTSKLLPIGLSAFLTALPSQAATVNVSGLFSGENVSASPSAISGSWAASFDTSTLIGGTGSITVNADSFVLNPNPLGVTVFDTSNVQVWGQFSSNELTTLHVGGEFNGGPGGMSFGADDFHAFYTGSELPLVSLEWTIASNPKVLESADTLSGGATIVPTPAAGWLLAFAITSLCSIRNTRRKW